MLTQKDLDQIENIVDEKLNERLKLLPTKDEFFTSQDELLGEIKSFREEMTLIPDRLADHTDKIEKLEKIHPQGRHPQTSA